MVEISKVKKRAKKEEISKDERDALIKQLMQELYTRSPIMYAAYEIKKRSDGYIQAGEKLSTKTQVERTFNAQSAVGNEDLKNEYIYKSLVTVMEKILKENIKTEDLPEPLKSEFVKYESFKKEQDDAIKGLPGNTKGITFPEIYSIVNFIGIHSNTELNTLAQELGIVTNYEIEVLPLLQSIQNNEKYYNKVDSGKEKAGTLTEAGRKLRNKIITKYGAKIRLQYGIEEENILPTITDEMVELLELNGYEVDFEIGSKTNEEKLEEFREKLSQSDRDYVDSLMNTLVRIRDNDQVGIEVGRNR